MYAALFCYVTMVVCNIKCMLYNISQPSRCKVNLPVNLGMTPVTRILTDESIRVTGRGGRPRLRLTMKI